MHHLYFICPTDHLERAICAAFPGDHYFVTSLGNAIAFDGEELQEFQAWLQEWNIGAITFVLADDNRIVREALSNAQVISAPSNNPLAKELAQALRSSMEQLPALTDPVAITAGFLERKAERLQAKLAAALGPDFPVHAAIFKRTEGQFVWPAEALWRLAPHQLN